MEEIVREVTKKSLLAASYKHLIAYETYCARTLPNGELHDNPQYTCAISGVLSPYMNTVVKTRLSPGDNVDEWIETVLAHARRRSVPLGWFLLPGDEPAELVSSLEAHGLTHTGNDPAMAIDLHTLPESLPALEGLRIVEVLDLPTLEEWVNTQGESYGANAAGRQSRFDMRASQGLGTSLPYRSFLAYLDNQPVATSELFLGAGVAAVVWVGTVPSARRRGIGAAITLAPLLEARRLGFRIGALTASELGYPVYQQLGFQEMCRLPVYIWRPAA